MSASFLRREGRRGTRRRVHARFYRRARTPADLYPAKPGNMPLVSFCLYELFFPPLFVYGSFMKAESLTAAVTAFRLQLTCYGGFLKRRKAVG